MSTLLQKALTLLQPDQRGATSIEYGLIASLVAVAIIAGVTLLGDNLGNMFNTISNNIE